MQSPNFFLLALMTLQSAIANRPVEAQTGERSPDARLHRVRRELDMFRFVTATQPARMVNVTFNMQSRFLTRYGPFVLRSFILVDNSIFGGLTFGQKKWTIALAKRIVNYANALLRPFNLYVMATYVNPSSVVKGNSPFVSMGDSMFQEDFSYRLDKEAYSCDIAIVLRGNSNLELTGTYRPLSNLARWGYECKAFVAIDPKTPGFLRLAGIGLAHEVGHIFGVGHDGPECECEFPSCVMGEVVHPGKAETIVGWSKCSIRSLVQHLDWNAAKPGYTPQHVEGETYAVPISYDWNATCGNGIVEPGEACDCGSRRACRFNRCCLKCQLKKGAKCGVGTCCDLTTCQPRPSGSLCRPADDFDCDFPEFCDGHSTHCPPDVSVASNFTCGGGKKNCWKRFCLEPWGATYGGPNCTGDSVPLNIGGCRQLEKPG